MEAIVINRPISNKEDEEILNLVKNQSIDLFTNLKVSDKLSKFTKGHYEVSFEEKRKLNSKIFKHIIHFGERPVKNTPVTDLLMTDNVSIWHYHKFRAYFVISNLSYEIKAVEDLALKYEKVSYFTDSNLLNHFPIPGNVNLILPAKSKKKINFASVFSYAFFFKLRVLLAFLQINKVKRKKHIIIDHTIKQTCLNLHTLKPEKGNYNLQYLFETADENFMVLDDVEVPKFFQDNSFKLHSYYFKIGKNRLNSEYVLLNGFLSKNVRNKVKQQSIELKNKYDVIKSELTDPIDLLIINLIISLHSSTKFYLFKHFTFRKFFQKHPFKTISSIDENSPRIKSILDAGKMNKLSTFGIQHGIIHDLQPNYHFSPEDKIRNISADLTLIWGNYWENKLYNQANYPESSLKITGFIRTDIIPKLKSIEDKKLFDLNKDEQMIVFASQPIKDAEMRKRVAFEVFRGFKDIKNSRLVVKLHPAEMNNVGYYQDIADEAGCKNVIINGTTDLYLMISKADIVITSFSTVGLESVFFNKPLITIDPLKQDIQSYHKDQIAFQASNSTELSNCIKGILDGTLTFNQDVYNNYLSNQVYKIDGNVSKRCIEIIKSTNN